MIKLCIILMFLFGCSSSPSPSNRKLAKTCSTVATFKVLKKEKIGVAAKEKENYGVYGYFKFNRTKEYTHYKTVIKVKSLGTQEFYNCADKEMMHKFEKGNNYVVKISDKKMSLIEAGDEVVIRLWLDFDGGAFEWDNGRLIKVF